MENATEDSALDIFKNIISESSIDLTEADTRSKIIDRIFIECLGWTEKNIVRESHVHTGFLDYLFKIENHPIFVLEAKKVGYSFEIPITLNRRKYKINGTIWGNKPIRNAIIQAHDYAVNSGVKYCVISNGYQFIIFEAFTTGTDWKNSYCTCFRSYDDIINNFTPFYNLLSKDGVKSGSLQTYISKKREIVRFEKPLEYFNYTDLIVTQNSIARLLQPFIKNIFGEMIDNYQQDILKECYVYQIQNQIAGEVLKPSFDQLPHYADKFGIEKFIENVDSAGRFQISFEKCEEFLRKDTPEGSLILLLGGIGSGKTTFIHHLFKITLSNRSDILWFYVDFRQSSPEPNKIEEYILHSIVDDYEKRYEAMLKTGLDQYGFSTPKADFKDILQLFSLLTLQGHTISLVLDNVDQHSLTSPEYQEKVFLISQNLTKNLKTITILTLREESFFKSTMSGVINAYDLASNIFHISSPRFNDVIRKRVNYSLDILEKNNEEITNIFKTRFDLNNDDKRILSQFFRILRRSLDERREKGQEILEFMDDISGGNMRQSLYFFRKFMTSGNTDISEMFGIEERDNPNGKYWKGYIIPYHHVARAIILEDYKYYSMEKSFLMNIFDVNTQYTNSHILTLRILNYLYNRINSYSEIGKGYIKFSNLLYDAINVELNDSAVTDIIKKLALFGLIEFDNQSKHGLESATYLRITRTGLYYYNKLINKFVYLDLIWGDTPICDLNTLKKLRDSVDFDHINDPLDRIIKRFERTEIYIDYLKKMEIQELNNYLELAKSEFGNILFIEKIEQSFLIEKNYILKKMQQSRKRYGANKLIN